MRFTLMLGLGGYQDYSAVAQAAERAGWTTVSVPDSIFFPKNNVSEYPYHDTEAVRQALDGTPVVDPFVAMAGMAAVTDTLRFCPGVVKVPIRQPLILAKTLGSLAAICGGRVSLGAGISPWKEDFAYNGVSWAGRGRRLDECIEIIRGALTGEYFEYHGEFYDFGPIKMSPLPERAVPILIGGHSRPALRRAARVGDGWMSANSDFDALRSMIKDLEQFRSEYGTDQRADFEIQAMDMMARTADDFRRLRDLGVTDALVTPWDPYSASSDLETKLDGIRRFGDEIIPKV